ncbi:sugar phosphate isomerase/epimerase family protein [Gryllotalpicola reticulitermitis]|uniref:sugar phosphate isomerase/epimerase family protein n=1 Tax=Gryllotalpicola reticulitermitis TaxID=1184153 RepID=UPI0036F2D20C
MRFGASVWPWKWDTPYDKAVRRIGQAGFRATELIAWRPETFDEYYTPDTVALLKQTLDDEGMKISQFVVNNGPAASPDPRARQAAIDMFKKGVDTGRELGATIVNTVTHMPFDLPYPRITDRPLAQTFNLPLSKDLDWDQNWHDYVAVLKECADYAEQAGLVYSLEPHPFRYGGNTEGLLRLLEAVDSPALGVNVDPSHLFPIGDFPNMVIYRLGSRVVHCHFSDNDGATNVHWRPGMGKIDWTDTLQALKDVGFDGVVSLEFEDVPGVSRGQANVPGIYKGNDIATEGFEAEYKTALEYLTAIAHEVGLNVE